MCDNRLKFPPSNVFEAEIQEHRRNLQSNVTTDGASPLDIRVTKGLGSRGYEVLRVSIISHNAEVPESSLLNFTYSSPFIGRWRAAFDVGVSSSTCTSESISSIPESSDGDCINACTESDDCNFYVVDDDSVCKLYSSCDYSSSGEKDLTVFKKFGRNYLHSALVPVTTPGEAFQIDIDGIDVSIMLPAEDSQTSGIVWSDPCVSGRWVGCEMSSFALNRSVEMINALALDDTWHYWGLLGDNFYDQDGRLTKSLWDGLSLAAKSKIFQTVAGNHDIWVCGGPDCGDDFDQYGKSLGRFLK